MKGVLLGRPPLTECDRRPERGGNIDDTEYEYVGVLITEGHERPDLAVALHPLIKE